jgi:hypothetical protein
MLFIGGTFALTFGCYFLSRALLGSQRASDAKELAASTVFRIAALHGLLLALVFSEELSNLASLKQTVAREVNQLESIFHDLERFGGGNTAEMQTTIALYVQDVINVEWKLLNDQRDLSQNAEKLWDELYNDLLNLDATDDRQTWLQDRMLTQISSVGVERHTRQIAATTDVNLAFWIVAFVGIAAIAVSFVAFPPILANMAILSVYALYVGIVLFFINTFDFPFSGLGGIQPIGFQLFLDHSLAPLVPKP